jgi:hypothetical protein
MPPGQSGQLGANFRLTGSSTAMTKMNLQIAHQVPGRVRMKIPAGKGNPELLKQISEVFGAIPGIEEVTVNPTTGSVVLHYDADRHDEFHGTFHQHYAAHGAADNGGRQSRRRQWRDAWR